MNAAGLASLAPQRRSEILSLFHGLRTVRAISNYVRITHHRFGTVPLGASSGPSRFSPVRSPKGHPPFRVIYAAADLATAAYETVIRDRLDLEPARILTPAEYASRIAINLSTAPHQSVTLLDLTRGNATRHGVPTDVTSYSRHTDGQHFAEFVHTHIPAADGLLYRSRFTDRPSLVVFDRAIGRLAVGAVMPLSRERLAAALVRWNVRVT